MVDEIAFGTMTLKSNIFNLKWQTFGFEGIKNSTLNWEEHPVFDDEFDGMFTIKYESFSIDDEFKYDVFEFDDLCYAVDCLIAFASESNSPPASLQLKHLPDSIKYSFLGPDEFLRVIIA